MLACFQWCCVAEISVPSAMTRLDTARRLLKGRSHTPQHGLAGGFGTQPAQ